MVGLMDTTTIRQTFMNPKGDWTRDQAVKGDRASVVQEINAARAEGRFANFEQANGDGATAHATDKLEVL